MSGRETIEKMVAERIIKALQDGVCPWRRPWNLSGGSLPRNIKSKKFYRGSNVFVLGVAGFDNSWWGTYRQWTELGATIKDGEGANYSIVTYWNRKPRRVQDESGEWVTKNMFILRYTKAYNALQVDNAPAKYLETPEPTPAPEAHAQAEKILAGYYGSEDAPGHVHTNPNRAYYQPGIDLVNTPGIECYDAGDQAEYYSTEFHEAGHSTGHSTRCNREGIDNFDHFGSEKYSKEELVAEMSAAMLCAITGVETDSSFKNSAAYIKNSAAYIKSWTAKLTDEPSLVMKAAGQAQKAIDVIQGTTFADEEV